MKTYKLALLAFGFGALSGCNTTGCTNDPLTDSLACANQNLRTGVYQQQTADLSAQANARNAEKAQLSGESDRLARQNASLQTQRKALQQKQAAMNGELSALKKKVASLTESGAISPAEAAAYQGQVDNLAARQQAAADEAEIASLQREIDELKKAVELF